MRIRIVLAYVLTALVALPSVLLAQGAQTARDTGVSGIWILANFCYAGMRAQGHESVGWRIASFFFGFPGTLVTLFVVREGEERAYGVELPTDIQGGH